MSSSNEINDQDIHPAIRSILKIYFLLRPKPYNVMSRIVLLVGISMLGASIPFIEILIIAAIERLAEPSELLRGVLSSYGNPYVGVILIIMALLYNLFMFVFDRLIPFLPHPPKLKPVVFDADGEEYASSTIQLRGALVEIPDQKLIKDYRTPNHAARLPGGTLITIPNQDFMMGRRDNTDYYRQKAQQLKKWGGSEVLRFSIVNDSGFLAENVSMEIYIPKGAGVVTDNTRDLAPKHILKHKRDPLLSPHLNLTERKWSLIRCASENEHCFEWNVGSVQGNTRAHCPEFLFIQVKEPIEMEVILYCDNFATPQKSKFTIAPTPEAVDISLTDILTDDQDQLLNMYVMDGLPERELEREMKRREHEQTDSSL